MDEHDIVARKSPQEWEYRVFAGILRKFLATEPVMIERLFTIDATVALTQDEMLFLADYAREHDLSFTVG